MHIPALCSSQHTKQEHLDEPFSIDPTIHQGIHIKIINHIQCFTNIPKLGQDNAKGQYYLEEGQGKGRIVQYQAGGKEHNLSFDGNDYLRRSRDQSAESGSINMNYLTVSPRCIYLFLYCIDTYSVSITYPRRKS